MTTSLVEIFRNAESERLRLTRRLYVMQGEYPHHSQILSHLHDTLALWGAANAMMLLRYPSINEPAEKP